MAEPSRTELDDLCHCCNQPTTADDPLTDTCADCLEQCPCWSCRETRVDIAQDREDERRYEMARDERWAL